MGATAVSTEQKWLIHFFFAIQFLSKGPRKQSF